MRQHLHSYRFLATIAFGTDEHLPVMISDRASNCYIAFAGKSSHWRVYAA
jgi:hypothetical protein